MGRLLGMHERSTIGKAISQAHGGAAARITLVASPTTTEPQKFIILSTTKVCLRQGGVAVVATVSDMWLPANTPMEITVENADQAYLSVITPSGGTAGTVTVFENSAAAPGTGTSA